MNLSPKLTHLLNLTKEALFPSVCLNCRKETFKELPRLKSGWFCENCRQELRPTWQTLCHICAKEASFSGSRNCVHSPASLENISFLFLYQNPVVRALIHGLKYNLITSLTQELAPLIEKERLNFFRMPVDIIVPLPLHKRKLRSRGFNQAELIALEIVNVLEKPILKNVLIKRRPTQAQMKIKRPHLRQKNIENAFGVTRPEEVEFKNVLLVDDVITTGATLEEAGHVLRAAGARKVYGFVLAKD